MGYLGEEEEEKEETKENMMREQLCEICRQPLADEGALEVYLFDEDKADYSADSVIVHETCFYGKYFEFDPLPRIKHCNNNEKEQS